MYYANLQYSRLLREKWIYYVPNYRECVCRGLEPHHRFFACLYAFSVPPTPRRAIPHVDPLLVLQVR
jgi:hypothetical protein